MQHVFYYVCVSHWQLVLSWEWKNLNKIECWVIWTWTPCSILHLLETSTLIYSRIVITTPTNFKYILQIFILW